MNTPLDVDRVLALPLAAGLEIKRPGWLSRSGILEADLISFVDSEKCGKGFPRPNLQPGSAVDVIRGNAKLRIVLVADAAPLGDGLEGSALDLNRAKLLVESAAQQSQLDNCAERILAARDSGELSDGDATKLYKMIDQRRDALREVARAPQLPLICGTSATRPASLAPHEAVAPAVDNQPTAETTAPAAQASIEELGFRHDELYASTWTGDRYVMVPRSAEESERLRARRLHDRARARHDHAAAEAVRRERLDREEDYKCWRENEARGSGQEYEYEPCADHRFAGEGSSALPDSSAGAPAPTTQHWYGK
jgi:hypothetical protein